MFQLDGKKSEREGKKKIVSGEKKMQEERKKTIEGKEPSFTNNIVSLLIAQRKRFLFDLFTYCIPNN